MLNKKLLKSKKGFTIVELVIVIAVIAILAAVLIPTFTNVSAKAKVSAAKSNAKTAYEQYVLDAIDAEVDYSNASGYVVSGDYVFEVKNGAIDIPDDIEKDTLSADCTYTAVIYGKVEIYLSTNADLLKANPSLSYNAYNAAAYSFSSYSNNSNSSTSGYVQISISDNINCYFTFANGSLDTTGTTTKPEISSTEQNSYEYTQDTTYINVYVKTAKAQASQNP